MTLDRARLRMSVNVVCDASGPERMFTGSLTGGQSFEPAGAIS